MPSLKSKMEYLKEIYARYRKAAKQEKGAILQEFCKVCGYNRKYAIGLLNAPVLGKKQGARRQRVCHYGSKVIEILEAIWKASGYLCSQRLKPALPLWLPSAKKRFPITPQLEKELLAISPRQMDNRLAAVKRQLKKRIYSATKPGRLLKSMIPVRTSNQDITLPGYLEIDLVVHCGGSLSGLFANTLNTTDIATGWSERRAFLGKSQESVRWAMQEIKEDLPFRLRGIDPDNGEEFINHLLLDFCYSANPPIEFTRSRPYKKNDQAHIEQRNDTHVRQILGWDRYDTAEAVEAINDLYRQEIRLLTNLFLPSMKLVKKMRVGSRLVRKYDTPQTPLDRLIVSGRYHRAKVKRLKNLRAALDPFELSRAIDRRLEAVYKMASQRIPAQNGFVVLKKQAIKSVRTNGSGAAHLPEYPKSNSPWRNFVFGRRRRKYNRILARLNRNLLLGAGQN